jgi:hypothetical protein
VTARMTNGSGIRGAMAVLLLVLSGCSSTISPAAAANGSDTAPPATTNVSSRTGLSGPISIDRTPNAPAGSIPVPTKQDCSVPAARAVAAAAALLPEGTSRTPQPTENCSDGQSLDVTFPAVGKLTWTVTVKVTAGTAADCESGASNASASCGPVVGHPGFVGAEAVCSAIACDQAWVFRGADLVVVSGSVPDTQPGMSQRAIPAFQGLGMLIGVSVLSALDR